MAGILIYIALWMVLSVGFSYLLSRWSSTILWKRRSGT